MILHTIIKRLNHCIWQEEKKKKQVVAEKKFFALKGAAVIHRQLEISEKEKIPKLEADITNLTTEIDNKKEDVEDANDAVSVSHQFVVPSF